MASRSVRGPSPAAQSLGVALTVVAILAALVAVMAVIVTASRVPVENPFRAERLYLDPGGIAAGIAAGDDPRAELIAPIAAQPTATWLLPEQHPVGEVGDYAADIAGAADASGRMALFVVYGVPGRDCDAGLSGGGLADDDAYAAWTAEIAEALEGTGSAVVLEPDALPLAITCDAVETRVAQLAGAVDRFAAADVLTYIDAGHSRWQSAAAMADLLDRVGVGEVRGFSTNVSNYNDDASERAWAEQLSGLLGGARYVVDTSRNGNGSDGGWCNPSGRALGAPPGPVEDGSHQDADLWIKNPGTSDGVCNGGPRAGDWWWTGALDLVGAR